MATYAEWNSAIWEVLFTEDVDDVVYLQIDEDVLAEVASISALSIKKDSPSDDFIASVCTRVVKGNKIVLDFADGELPEMVTFLAFCVLAASQMANDEIGDTQVASTNYYSRFFSLLGFRSDFPRVNKIEVHRLWLQLQRFLKEHGKGNLQLTDGPITKKYVWYPISQALLTAEDRKKLWVFFKSHNFPLGHLPED